MAVSGQPASAWSAPAWLTPTRLAMGIFFVQATAINNWFPRIPDVQAKLGIGPAELSIALLAMPIGGFVATALSARLIEHLSARRTLMFAAVAFAVIFMLPGWAWNLPSLCVALFLMGVGYVIGDIAVNVEAMRIQAAGGRRILSTCHGFWSLGSIFGLVVGSAFAETGIGVGLHMMIVSVVMAPLAVRLATWLPAMPKRAEDDVERAPIVALPSAAMVTLCLFAFGVIIGELTVRNWGAVYLREAVGTSAAGAGIAFAAFSIAMTAFRLLGDRLTDRFGAVALGRFCAAAAIVGVIAVVTADNLIVATAGFAALGVGVSVGFPLAVSAAASLRQRTPATNVAALSLIAYTGSLVGPPLVGFVAQTGGLRIGLAAILPLMVLSALFAGSLRRR